MVFLKFTKLVASHFNEYKGDKAFMGYNKSEGISGVSTDKVEAASSKVSIIDHWHAGFRSGNSTAKLDCSSNMGLIFFSRA